MGKMLFRAMQRCVAELRSCEVAKLRSLNHTTRFDVPAFNRGLSLCKTDEQTRRLNLSCGLPFVLTGSAAHVQPLM